MISLLGYRCTTLRGGILLICKSRIPQLQVLWVAVAPPVEYDRPYLSHEAEGSTFERLEGWRGTDYPFAVIVLARNFHHWRRLPRVAACAGAPATTCASTLSLSASRAWPIPSPPKRILRMPTLNSGIYSASA